MRISFLAVLAVALIVGLGVVVAIRALGLLSPPPVASAAAPAPPPVYVPQVLVAQRPLFAGDTILKPDLGTRALLPSEVEDYKLHKDDYLPAAAQSALFRAPTKTIEANRPLRKDDFQEIKKPDPLHSRLLPGTRAVNVSITKDQSAGGLIQPGDWVDVYVVTEFPVSTDPTAAKARRSGVLARNAQVVAKRDSLYPLFAPLADAPVQYTLGLNPYRASLIEFGRTVGSLSLVPVAEYDKAKLDKVRDEAMKDPGKAEFITLGEAGSREAQEEKAKVEDYTYGGFGVGTADVAEALQLKPLPKPPRPVNIAISNGTSGTKTVTFVPGGDFDAAPEYTFSAPAGMYTGTGNGSGGGAGGGGGGGGSGTGVNRVVQPTTITPRRTVVQPARPSAPVAPPPR